MLFMTTILDKDILANAVRYLAIDMVEAAASGHPGAPLGMADIATVLWKEVLRYNPAVPASYDRDRVVLSNGHACAMLYAVLYLAGYPIEKKDLESFRQVGSITAGHPEREPDIGIEVSTGPLGQGVANAVGLAISRAAKKAPDNDYWVYCFLGDGCLMEGVSYEACSLAGTLKLQNLIFLYDSNDISIDGHVGGWFADNVSERFKSQGWHVIDQVDGHDHQAIKQALIHAKQQSATAPTIIIFKTQIGRFIPDWAGEAICHGQPLGAERALATKQAMHMNGLPFELNEDVLKAWRTHSHSRLSAAETTCPARPDIDWQTLFDWAYQQKGALATRVASFQVMDQLPDVFITGCADLTGSVYTKYPKNALIKTEGGIGNYIHYGVREFAMSAIGNGIAVDGFKIPVVGTFLIFSDYAKNAIRMSALMQLQVIYVLTHDSIGLGEDGPTHQPVEQLAMLRATPNLNVWRPCDLAETVVAWKHAYASSATPTSIVLTRQKIAQQEKRAMSEIEKGGYILKYQARPDLILIATGSEVELAMAVASGLGQRGIAVQVVSMPCMELFRSQSSSYKARVLPVGVAKVAIEAAATQPWFEWVGSDGLVIGLDTFGESGPGDKVMSHYGFDAEKILQRVLEKFNSIKYKGEKYDTFWD